MEMAGPNQACDGQHFGLPGQRYFMNFGPWISETTFLLQAAATLAALILAWLRHPRRFRNLARLLAGWDISWRVRGEANSVPTRLHAPSFPGLPPRGSSQ